MLVILMSQIPQIIVYESLSHRPPIEDAVETSTPTDHHRSYELIAALTRLGGILPPADIHMLMNPSVNPARHQELMGETQKRIGILAADQMSLEFGPMRQPYSSADSRR